jgi:hypothetical protein
MNWLIARLSNTNAGALIGGLALIAIGLVCLWVASGYRVGELNRFGPGFFPIVISLITIFFGIAVVFENGPIDRDFQPTPLRSVVLVFLSVLAFALLIRNFGGVAATIGMVFFAALAQDRFRPMTTLVFAIVASVVMYVLFVRLLRMPINPFPWS